MITITNKNTGHVFQVNEQTSLANIREKDPKFFATKLGKRETYTMYRGALIVRNTVAELLYGIHRKNVRKTTVYLFVVGGNDSQTHYPYTFCVSAGNHVKSIAQAKKLIDRILEEQRYSYDLDAE